MRRYEVWGRLIGDTSDPEYLIGFVTANNLKDAYRKARYEHFTIPDMIVETVTKVKFIGVLNPDWNAEQALLSAIFGETYNVPQYLR